MVATGGLVLALIYFGAAWRGDSPSSFRAGYKALLYAAVPGFIVMRLAAQWTVSQEHLDNLDSDPSWLGIGFMVGDAGLLFLADRDDHRRRLDAQLIRGRRCCDPRQHRVHRLLLVAYVVAVWAMTAKPA